MTEPAELMTRHCVFALLGETCAHLSNEAGYHHGVHIRVGQEETVQHIGAGNAELHRHSYRHLDAMRHEVVLRAYNPPRDPKLGLQRRPDIALAESAFNI